MYERRWEYVVPARSVGGEIVSRVGSHQNRNGGGRRFDEARNFAPPLLLAEARPSQLDLARALYSCRARSRLEVMRRVTASGRLFALRANIEHTRNKVRGEEQQDRRREEAQKNMLYGLVHRSGKLQPFIRGHPRTRLPPSHLCSGKPWGNVRM